MYEYSGRDPRGHLRGHLEDTPEDTQDDTQRTPRRTFPLSSEGQTELYPKISLLGYDDQVVNIYLHTYIVACTEDTMISLGQAFHPPQSVQYVYHTILVLVPMESIYRLDCSRWEPQLICVSAVQYSTAHINMQNIRWFNPRWWWPLASPVTAENKGL